MKVFYLPRLSRYMISSTYMCTVSNWFLFSLPFFQCFQHNGTSWKSDEHDWRNDSFSSRRFWRTTRSYWSTNFATGKHYLKSFYIMEFQWISNINTKVLQKCSWDNFKLFFLAKLIFVRYLIGLHTWLIFFEIWFQSSKFNI